MIATLLSDSYETAPNLGLAAVVMGLLALIAALMMIGARSDG